MEFNGTLLVTDIKDIDLSTITDNKQVLVFRKDNSYNFNYNLIKNYLFIKTDYEELYKFQLIGNTGIYDSNTQSYSNGECYLKIGDNVIDLYGIDEQFQIEDFDFQIGIDNCYSAITDALKKDTKNIYNLTFESTEDKYYYFDSVYIYKLQTSYLIFDFKNMFTDSKLKWDRSVNLFIMNKDLSRYCRMEFSVKQITEIIGNSINSNMSVKLFEELLFIPYCAEREVSESMLNINSEMFNTKELIESIYSPLYIDDIYGFKAYIMTRTSVYKIRYEYPKEFEGSEELRLFKLKSEAIYSYLVLNRHEIDIITGERINGDNIEIFRDNEHVLLQEYGYGYGYGFSRDLTNLDGDVEELNSRELRKFIIYKNIDGIYVKISTDKDGRIKEMREAITKYKIVKSLTE